jgi:hypothetical protein
MSAFAIHARKSLASDKPLVFLAITQSPLKFFNHLSDFSTYQRVSHEPTFFGYGFTSQTFAFCGTFRIRGHAIERAG